ncbi:MAG: iron-containing alcohol dehydrogenase [Clostridiaceae bacterium]|nr:iron-containing alcohol dehydrogenase [Clostridiaceae bacterium]
MQNFDYKIDTEILFGRGQITRLGMAVRAYAKSALVVYGGGSVVRSGVLQAALAQLEAAGVSHVELPGVQPNPRISSVRAGVRICRGQKLEAVLAVGGGSSIDCAKAIAAGACYDGDPWDLVCEPARIRTALPVFSVLTLAATGSEMDAIAVISNPDTRDKKGFGASCLRPKASVLDPTYTFSVPKYQTAAGTADIMSHILENYFSPEEGAFIQEGFAETLLRACVKYGPAAMAKPDDYEARANLMWASSHAINGLISLGRPVPWSVHSMEHQLSAWYDLTHGVGLAILTPHWMDIVLSEQTAPRFARYGEAVFGLHGETMELARGAVAATRAFFKKMELPASLSDVGIGDKHISEMAEKARTPAFDRTYVPLSVSDIEHIYRAAL